MFYNIVTKSCFVIFKIFYDFKIYDLKYVPRKEPYILASNHASHLDPLVLAAAIPRKVRFMGRQNLFTFNPFFGWFIRDLGAFPVKRKTGDITAFKKALRFLKNGEPLGMFPEGTRQANGILGQPQAGVGMLASRLGVPIVPAFIKGTEEAFPKGSKVLHPSRISVRFGKQINVERRTPYQDIAQRVMQEIRQLSCPVSD
jgi:1-acyl-sn-glycerol-3-phosphate acyltransferase